MDLPLSDAPPDVRIHLAAALCALMLGPFALYRKRRDRLHKVLGYAWVGAMTVTALSSFTISGLALIGPFSPIHALSIVVLLWLWRGVRAAICGNRPAHAKIMRSLYWSALGLAGLFTLLPGRLLNRSLFPEAPHLGYVAIGVGLAVIGLQAWPRRWRVRARRAAG
jgi:uncharacterized membrane protein